MGDYRITAKHELTLGWSPKAGEPQWSITGAIVVELARDEFLVAKTGIVLTFRPKTGDGHAGILRIDEGSFVNGKWLRGR